MILCICGNILRGLKTPADCPLFAEICVPENPWEHVWFQMKEHVIPGINTDYQMNEFISLNQGSGGKLTHELIEKVFVKRFGMTEPLTDSAILKESGFTLAFTTDSYVVDPLFFPGGNIGKLAVCGTVNDLAVSGAVPAYISASFIIEEGFP